MMPCVKNTTYIKSLLGTCVGASTRESGGGFYVANELSLEGSYEFCEAEGRRKDITGMRHSYYKGTETGDDGSTLLPLM